LRPLRTGRVQPAFRRHRPRSVDRQADHRRARGNGRGREPSGQGVDVHRGITAASRPEAAPDARRRARTRSHDARPAELVAPVQKLAISAAATAEAIAPAKQIRLNENMLASPCLVPVCRCYTPNPWSKRRASNYICVTYWYLTIISERRVN